MSLQYLNNYRGIAILLVVLSHAVAALPEPHSPIIHFLSPIFGCGTLLFVLVAGQFFTALSDKYSYIPFLKNKFKFVVLPYIGLSMPAALIYIFNIKKDHDWVDMTWLHSLNPFEQYAYLMGTGAHLGPLWFVPMILLYYIASPILVLILRRNLVFPIFLASLAFAMHIGRPANNSNYLQSAFYFLPAYLLGMFIGQNTKILAKLSSFAYRGFATCILLLLSIGKLQYLHLSWHLPLALATACFLITICMNHLNQKIKLLDLFARLSFYIFFVHGYIIALFRIGLSKHAANEADIMIVLLVFIATVILSIAAYIPLKLMLRDRSKLLLAA